MVFYSSDGLIWIWEQESNSNVGSARVISVEIYWIIITEHVVLLSSISYLRWWENPEAQSKGSAKRENDGKWRRCKGESGGK